MPKPVPKSRRAGSAEDHAADQRDLEVLRLLDKGLSQNQVARRLGVAQGHVSIIKKAAKE